VKGAANPDPSKNGCPLDQDSDGVPDTKDACPAIAGAASQDAAANGCPGDTDGDTVRDDLDACPRKKGKPDSDPKKSGCPQSVRVTEREIVILQQVEFEFGKGAIKKVSGPLLDEIAAVLKEHPEILKVEVQGHSDNVGSPEFNKLLSAQRAASVKKALIERGIGEARLTSAGYGQKMPIASNSTAEGRQKNRRVELKILETKPRP
jgi:outer membrane protein OmpA-like peptidoglycan-associated protein